MIVILLLLYSISFSLCAEYRIDLTQCGKTADCFLRDSCVKQSTNANILSQLLKYDDLKNVDCDVMIQIRAYSAFKWHVIIQVNASGYAESIDDSGVSLKQGDVQFECTKSGPTGNNKTISMFKIVQKGYFTYEDKLVLCSFTMETIVVEATPRAKIYATFTSNSDKPKLKFNLGSLQYPGIEELLWKTINERCDPDKINSTERETDIFRLDQADVYALPPIKCGSKSMIITHENSSSTVLGKGAEMQCISRSWKYNDIVFDEDAKFNLTCGVKFCTLCPPFERLECNGCSPPEYGNNNETECLTSKCPGNLWQLDRIGVLKGEMECKQDTENSRNASWYLNDGSKSVKFSKADCFDKNICRDTSNLMKGCSPGFECTIFDFSSDNTIVECPKERKTIGWVSKEGPVTETANISCDFFTGKFRDGNSTEIPKGSTVFCGERKNSTVAEQSSTLGATVGGAVGGVLALVGIVVVAIIFIRRRQSKKNEAPPTGNGSQETKSRTNNTDPSAKPFAAPTPIEDAYNKGSVKKDQRGPWSKRRCGLPEITPGDGVLDPRMDSGMFIDFIIPQFVQYNLDNRKTIVYNITAFNGYASDEGDGKSKIGHFHDFFNFFLLACEQKYLDCLPTWEMMWRVLKVLYGKMKDKHFDDNMNNLDERFKARMIKFAKPILDDLGWMIKKDEKVADTWMRFFVARVLLWAEDKATMKELKKLSLHGLPRIESPLRAVVWQYAVRYRKKDQDGGGGQYLKRKHLTKLFNDPQNPEKDKFGTVRQHLSYAICTYRDEDQAIEFDVMRGVLDDLYRFNPIDKSYTPPDVYWAYLGATEYYENMRPAIDHFIRNTPRNLDDIRAEQLEVKHKNKTDKEVVAIKKEWMQASMDTANALAECCTKGQRYQDLIDPISFYTSYCEDLTEGGIRSIHNEARLFERGTNLETRFDKDTLKPDPDKKRFALHDHDRKLGGVDAEFSEALAKIEENKEKKKIVIQ